MAEIPLWLAILIVSRDILIVGAVMLAGMLGQPVEMRPRIISKANTTAQIVLAGIVLGDLAYPIDLAMVRNVVVVLVGFLTIASTLVYANDWVKHMGSGTPEGTPPADPGRT
jgi:cardiolipin synthase